jgi:hypothetical protein
MNQLDTGFTLCCSVRQQQLEFKRALFTRLETENRALTTDGWFSFKTAFIDQTVNMQSRK